jgi:translation initiation factor 2 beta subunit (eIF-2beta)/eIF-5
VQTQESGSIDHADFTDEVESTLIKVLIDIKNHYTADPDYHFKDLIQAFETKELENNILQILNFGLIEGKMQKMYEEFNKLLKPV